MNLRANSNEKKTHNNGNGRSIWAENSAQILGSGIKNTENRVQKPTAALDAQAIVVRLEEAGAALLAMPASGYSTRLRQMRFDIVHTALEAYGWATPALRAPVPSAAAISAMDEAFGWLSLIPEAKYVLRRILGARALVHPLTGRHLFPWRRLGAVLNADHKSIQRWHGEGAAMIAAKLAQIS